VVPVLLVEGVAAAILALLLALASLRLLVRTYHILLERAQSADGAQAASGRRPAGGVAGTSGPDHASKASRAVASAVSASGDRAAGQRGLHRAPGSG
jgi:hypothetical protein